MPQARVPSSWVRRRMAGGGFDAQRIEKKSPFMAAVIGLLIVQLFLTFYLMKTLSGSARFLGYVDQNFWFRIVLLVIPLVLILILALIPMPMYAKLLLFTLFSVSFGMLFAIAQRSLTPEMLRAALLGTIGIFVAMFLVGLVLAGFGYDLLWLGLILFVVLIILLVLGIAMLFTHPEQKVIRARAILVVILFSVYVLYDTNQILMRDYQGDYVTAGIDYYLDFMNIFLHLIESWR